MSSYRKNFVLGEDISEVDINYNFNVLQNGMFVKGEIPSGVIDGSNDTFTPLYQFITGSIEVFIMFAGGAGCFREILTTHYTETPANTSIVFVTPPPAGATIVVNYTKLTA